jgi:hypothetical protein
MLEMKYLKVPTVEEGGVASSSSVEEASPRRPMLGSLRALFRYCNSMLHITNQQQSSSEKKIAFFAFMVLFVCFFFTSFFVFSGGDVCSSYQQGLERLRAQNEHLAKELAQLRKTNVIP